MSKLFYVDQAHDHIYTFADLLAAVNRADSYAPVNSEGSVFNFWIELLVAMAEQKDVTLLDADFSAQEIKALGYDAAEIAARRALKPRNKIPSVEALIERVCRSTARIALFTSGTTGRPRKITHSSGTLLRGVKRSDRYKNKVWGFAFNHSHIAGLQVFFQALCNGNTLVHIFNKTRDDILASIETWSITHVSATPTFYRLLVPLDSPIHTLEQITLGGERVDERLIDRVKASFPQASVTNLYASTETGSLFSSRNEVFEPLDEIEALVRIEDGELLIHRSLLPEISIEPTGDWYYSGDLVQVINREPLRFRFLSRKAEVINVGGYKVNPAEVEDVIGGYNGVSGCRVFGKKNALLGHIIAAEVRVEKATTEKELIDYAAAHLQPHKVPRLIRIVDMLKTTHTGKVRH